MVIYLTKNLINGKKYIGKDSNNNPKYLGSGVLLLKDIKKFGRSNFKKEILEHCENDEELAARESFWIKKHKAIESNMYYNLIDYNTGWNIHNLSTKKYNYIRNKISKSKIGKSLNMSEKDFIIRNKRISKANKGKPKPKGFGEKISKIKLSQKIKMSQETKDKISKAKKNHPCFQTASFKEKKMKPVIQMDKEGNIISEFKSIKEAADSNPKFKRSNISCCLTRISKTAYGYKWEYK